MSLLAGTDRNCIFSESAAACHRIPRGTVSHAARYPTRHDIPRGTVPTRHRIPRGTGSTVLHCLDQEAERPKRHGDDVDERGRLGVIMRVQQHDWKLYHRHPARLRGEPESASGSSELQRSNKGPQPSGASRETCTVQAPRKDSQTTLIASKRSSLPSLRMRL